MKQFLLASLIALFCAGFAMAGAGADIYKASCAGCHGVDGSKASGGSTPLKGQNAEDILQKLNGYAGGGFGGKQKHVMENIVQKHDAGELRDLADYAATL